MILALHKPYDVLSQFTPEEPGQRTLAEFGFPPDVYPVGRLDRDSEGLLLLTNERGIAERLLNPQHQHPRIYQVQVERIPTTDALEKLRKGVVIQGKTTRPAEVEMMSEAPDFPPRHPPIRVRLSVPTAWISLTLTEGLNRQVRRMTAAVGHPTLRLVRTSIGSLCLGNLAPGKWRELSDLDRRALFA